MSAATLDGWVLAMDAQHRAICSESGVFSYRASWWPWSFRTVTDVHMTCEHCSFNRCWHRKGEHA